MGDAVTANAVIQASLAEIKFVKTRSVCCLILEIPIEAAEDAINKFGIPLPGQEIPVALARLISPQSNAGAPLVADAGVGSKGSTQERQRTVDPVKSERGKAAYHDADERSRAAMRAGRMRGEKQYRDFLLKLTHVYCADKDNAASIQHHLLGIKSSVEFQTDDAAYQRFLNHEHQYGVFQGREAEPR